MRPKSKIFRYISSLLTVMILSQSCTIYRSTNISVEEAIETKNKVKVKTNSNEFKFKRIEKDDAGIYGIANKDLIDTRKLSEDIFLEDISKNLVKITLQENEIKEIKPRNKTLSVLVPVAIAAGILIFALTYEVGNLLPHGI